MGHQALAMEMEHLGRLWQLSYFSIAPHRFGSTVPLVYASVFRFSLFTSYLPTCHHPIRQYRREAVNVVPHGGNVLDNRHQNTRSVLRLSPAVDLPADEPNALREVSCLVVNGCG